MRAHAFEDQGRDGGARLSDPAIACGLLEHLAQINAVHNLKPGVAEPAPSRGRGARRCRADQGPDAAGSLSNGNEFQKRPQIVAIASLMRTRLYLLLSATLLAAAILLV